MKRVVVMFLIILTNIISCCNVYGLAPPPMVEGVIYLPNEAVAPAGGIHVKVILESIYSSMSKEYIIEEGQNYINYSIKNVYLDGDYTVRCELIAPIEGYSNVSYYTGDKLKPFECFAIKLYRYDTNVCINIPLVETKKVTGTLLLPDGLSAQGDSVVTVNVVAQSDPYVAFEAYLLTDKYYNEEVKTVIKKGENKGTFEVELPVYSPGYYFNYKLNDYISGVCPDSINFDARTEIIKDTSVELTLDKGNIIKGKVSLPDGEVARTGGYPVTVSASYESWDNTVGESITFTSHIYNRAIIPEGANCVDYEITVYPRYSKYYVFYSLEGKEYVENGYYSPTGTLTKLDEDNCVINIECDVDDINLYVLNGVKVTGKIIYPYEQVALKDLSGELVITSNDQISRSYEFTIKKDSSYADFEFVVPHDLGDFTLSYATVDDRISPAVVGYYNAVGTTTYRSKAQRLEPKNDSIGDLQFVILGCDKISGILKLPDDMESFVQSREFEVLAQDKYDDGNNSYKYIDTCVLEPGERSSSFEILVPQDFDDVILSCSLSRESTSDTSSITESYLGIDGMVLDKENAKIINPGQSNSTDIEIYPIGDEFYQHVILGDLDNNGTINSIDFAKLRGYLLGMISPSEVNLLNADLNLDGQVNAIDFGWFRKYLLGIIKYFPA